MIELDRVLNEINKSQEYIGILLNSLKNDYFCDTSINIDERWKVFEQIVNKGIYKNTQLYGDGFIDILSENRESTLYDDFYVEKYQTQSFIDMYSKIVDDAEKRYHARSY